MTIDEVIELLNASQLKKLTSLQEMVLRLAWQGKTYTEMANESNYVKEYLSRTASELWLLLSDFWQEPLQKSNFRKRLEGYSLSPAHQQLIEEWRVRQKLSSLDLSRDSKAFESLERPLVKFPSGPVALDSIFYIERPPVETLAYQEVVKPGSLIRIKSPEKMGKSSLMIRIFAYASQQNYQTILIDLQQVDRSFLASSANFFRWLCANVSRELQIPSKIEEYWDQEVGSKVSCTIYFQNYLLPQLASPLIFAFNEVHRIFEYPEIAKDFFPLLRFWYEQGKQTQLWQKIHWVLVYSTEPDIEFSLHQSPFNVGLPLKLPPFTFEQVVSLASRHGLSLNENQINQLMTLLGGHPYLLRLAFYYLSVSEKMTLTQLLEQAPTESGIYNHYLRHLYSLLHAKPQLMMAYQQVIAAREPVKLESYLAYRLDNLGLVVVKENDVAPLCELFRLFFRNEFSQFES